MSFHHTQIKCGSTLCFSTIDMYSTSIFFGMTYELFVWFHGLQSLVPKTMLVPEIVRNRSAISSVVSSLIPIYIYIYTVYIYISPIVPSNVDQINTSKHVRSILLLNPLTFIHLEPKRRPFLNG
jgi:hypothetical protein